MTKNSLNGRVSRRGWRAVAMTGVAASALLLVAACGSSSGSDASDGRTIRMITAISQSTPYIAAETGNELGAWKATGYTVKEIKGTTATVTTALAAGTADIGVTAGNEAALATAQGVNTVIPACIMGPWRQDLIVSPHITNVSQLKGATFGVSAAGSAGAFATTKLAAQQGWSKADYKVTALGTIQGLEAGLSSGRIKAFIWNPAVANDLAAKGTAKDLGSMEKVVGPNCFESFQVSTKFMDEHPAAVKAFFEGYFKNVAYLQSHYDAARKIVVNEWKYSESTVGNYLKDDIAALSTDGKIDSDQMSGLLEATQALQPSAKQDDVQKAYSYWRDLK